MSASTSRWAVAVEEDDPKESLLRERSADEALTKKGDEGVADQRREALAAASATREKESEREEECRLGESSSRSRSSFSSRRYDPKDPHRSHSGHRLRDHRRDVEHERHRDGRRDQDSRRSHEDERGERRYNSEHSRRRRHERRDRFESDRARSSYHSHPRDRNRHSEHGDISDNVRAKRVHQKSPRTSPPPRAHTASRSRSRSPISSHHSLPPTYRVDDDLDAPRSSRSDREAGRHAKSDRPGTFGPDSRERSHPRREFSGDQGQQPDHEEAQAPNFAPSGLLAAESNNIEGVALKYHEPPEARKPKKEWRLYTFKQGQEVGLRLLSQQSCHLFGRDRTVVDVPLDHPSCSKQHAVIQFRLTIEKNEFGDEKRSVRSVVLLSALLVSGRPPTARPSRLAAWNSSHKYGYTIFLLAGKVFTGQMY